MNEPEYVAVRFEEHRTHLRAVAYRMLRSLSEVDDAVQEAWLRLSRTDATQRGGGFFFTEGGDNEKGTRPCRVVRTLAGAIAMVRCVRQACACDAGFECQRSGEFVVSIQCLL